MPPFKSINSASNPTIKMLKSLHDKKGRSRHGLFLAEGRRLLAEGLHHGWEPRLLLVEHGSAAVSEPLFEQAASSGASLLSVPLRLLKALSGKDNAHIVLTAFAVRSMSLSALSGSGRCLALFEVRDPGNLGTILRTGDAVGLDGVIGLGSCCDRFAPECVRASMGSLFAMPFAGATVEEFLEWRHRQGISLIAASVSGITGHDDLSVRAPVAILMGNERHGVPEELASRCDRLVRIPMRHGADSLNLASATALMLYSLWRQHGYDGGV